MTPLDCHRAFRDLVAVSVAGFRWRSRDRAGVVVIAGYTDESTGYVYDLFGYETVANGWFFVRGCDAGTGRQREEISNATVARVFTTRPLEVPESSIERVL